MITYKDNIIQETLMKKAREKIAQKAKEQSSEAGANPPKQTGEMTDKSNSTQKARLRRFSGQ